MNAPSSSGQPPSLQTQPTNEPLFHLGRLLATPGALRTLEEFGVQPLTLILRHVTGDWGDLCKEDKQVNAVAVEFGSRIFSSYKLARADGDRVLAETVWVITEANDGTIGGPRECTTILLPREY